MCDASSSPMASWPLRRSFTSRPWRWWRACPVNWSHTGIFVVLTSRRSCGSHGSLRVYPPVRAALKRVEVEQCVRWMVPFAMTLREVGSSAMKSFAGISAEDMHNIQTHASYMTWLVRPKYGGSANHSNIAWSVTPNLEDAKILKKNLNLHFSDFLLHISSRL